MTLCGTTHAERMNRPTARVDARLLVELRDALDMRIGADRIDREVASLRVIATALALIEDWIIRGTNEASYELAKGLAKDD